MPKFPYAHELFHGPLTVQQQVKILLDNIPPMLEEIDHPSVKNLYTTKYDILSERYAMSPSTANRLMTEVFSLYRFLQQRLEYFQDNEKEVEVPQTGGSSGGAYHNLYRIYKNKYLRLKNASQYP